MAISPSFYKIGLGNKILNRAKLIFLVTLGLAAVIFTTAIYAEAKTGDIRKALSKPWQGLIASLESITKSTSTPSLQDPRSTFISTSSSEIHINTGVTATPQKTYYSKPKISPTPIKSAPTSNSSYSSGKSYEEMVKEMGERAAAERAKQDQWFKEQKAANQAWFQEQSAKNAQSAQDWFNQKVAEQQKALEQWKKEHGF
ncbi:MAG: hypothetical protein V1808_04040 [Candidatus Daviesbacteria bacterium]